MRITAFIAFVFIFFSCSRAYYVSNYESTSLVMNNTVETNDSLASVTINSYKNQLDGLMNEVLNISEVAMIKKQPEGLLGNFVADLVLKKGSAYYSQPIDICLLNNGGLRTALPQGEITRGKIYELMPFENELVVITLSSEKTRLMFEYLANTGGAPVAGIKMAIENNQPAKVLINGEPFDSTRTYKVVTSDYLANGGDKYFFLKDPLKREPLKVKIRDAIIEYIMQEKLQGRTLSSQYDGRIIYVH